MGYRTIRVGYHSRPGWWLFVMYNIPEPLVFLLTGHCLYNCCMGIV